MDLEGIMPSEMSDRERQILWSHLYVESKKYNKLVNKTKRSRPTDIENMLVVTSGERQGRVAI